MTARRAAGGTRARLGGAAAAVTVAALVAGTGVVGVAPAGAAPTYLADQWGLSVIGAPAAWQYGTGAGVRVGIVDTGVDASQEDLLGKVVAATTILSNPGGGCASSAQDPGGTDDNGHGTHVAGIAAAAGRYGVSGVAPGASLVVAKVMDCSGSGYMSDVAAGIDWVVAHGAKVVNLSIGDAGTGLVDTSNLTGNPMAGALQSAWQRGAIPVVAAGNNSGGLLGLGDANFSGVPAVVVAATGSPANGEGHVVASYSNTVNSAQWGVAGPGGDHVSPPQAGNAGQTTPSAPACGSYDQYEVLSTYWTAADPTSCYATDEGTSMATPFVTGALALLLGRGLGPSQAVQTLLQTADHSVACGSRCSGLVDVGAAMQAAAGQAAATAPSAAGRPPPVPSGAPSPAPGPSPAPSPTSTTTPPTPATAGPSARASAVGAHRHARGSGSGDWWIVLPLLVGLAAPAGAALARRRRSALRHPGGTVPPAPATP
ncbi:MAG: S8 family serine peptidase [Acidobacteriota bacterium]|nr:S8 family serine peptidase [Acidobacteriota bacterium]